TSSHRGLFPGHAPSSSRFCAAGGRVSVRGVTVKPDKNQQREARIGELEAALERSEKTVQALRDVGLALGSTLDLDQLLELILNKITELLEADRATLYLLDEQRGRLL